MSFITLDVCDDPISAEYKCDGYTRRINVSHIVTFTNWKGHAAIQVSTGPIYYSCIYDSIGVHDLIKKAD